VKTVRSEVKPPISPSSELRVSAESEEDDGYSKEIEDEGDAECLYCAGLFSEHHGRETWVRCQNCLKWAHTLLRPTRKGPLCVTGVRNDRRFFIVAAKCYEKLHFVIPINKTSCF
jgi:hypothetical protein